MIQLRNLRKTYKGRIVLDIENLEFERGKIYALLGPNGSGKTTLLRIIAGLEEADAGTVSRCNVDGAGLHSIAYMPQSVYMFDRTVLGNVMLGTQKEQDCFEKAKQALCKLGLEPLLNARARSLSGGEQQRVALARTMVLRSSLILLDEPASAADISAARRIEDYIAEVHNRSGATIIFTTHNPSQAARIAHEAVVLIDGKMADMGAAREVLKHSKVKEIEEFLNFWRSC